MPHSLEWSRAYTARLSESDAAGCEARSAELAQRLARETAAGELPFLSMPYRAKLEVEMAPLIPRLKAYKHMLVLGIGGSALGARAMQRAFAPGQDGPGHKGPWLWIADNVCAEQFEALLAKLSPSETVVVCISKSGGTIETLAQYFLVRDWLKAALGECWQEQMIVVTDERKGYLREEAVRYGLTALEVPDYLGGRYSALSAVGLLPAAFLGIDWQALLDGAAEVARPLVEQPESIARHPSFALACWAKALEDHGYSQLIFFTYIPSWASFGQWFGQLWAESLGKNGKGTMPLPAVGATDQHSLQQMFLDGPADKGCIQLHCPNLSKGPQFPDDVPDSWEWLRGKTFGALLNAETLGSAAALVHNGVPLTRLEVAESSMRAAGEVMGLLMATTVLTGWLMNINPLDQPAVELGKRLAYSRLGSSSYPEEAAILKAFLD